MIDLGLFGVVKWHAKQHITSGSFPSLCARPLARDFRTMVVFGKEGLKFSLLIKILVPLIETYTFMSLVSPSQTAPIHCCNASQEKGDKEPNTTWLMHQLSYYHQSFFLTYACLMHVLLLLHLHETKHKLAPTKTYDY